tara:strand:+ start:550 stop:1260 length:711 start_codon:yes stop_codon:yes gene_type:complete
MIIWNKTYYGPKPSDIKNKQNVFAGHFSGYEITIKNPADKKQNEYPLVLIMCDSIIGKCCISCIRNELKGIANVNVLQHPHHCKNIQTWLEKWEVDKWNYDVIFYFDGMHGFPMRVTEKEHQEFTPIIIEKLSKVSKNIIWGNCTPLPEDMPQGKKNSKKGPNSKEQILTNQSVIERNKSILISVNKYNIYLIDLYSLMRPIQKKMQFKKDAHFIKQGERIIAAKIISGIKKKLKL